MISTRPFIRFMKNKVLIPAIAGAAVVGFFSFRLINSSGGDENVATPSDSRKTLTVNTVMKAIQEGHFSPRMVNDSFSYAVWHKTVDQLDYGKKFFTQQDINALKPYELKIDDELKLGSVEFYDHLSEAFTKSIDRAENFEKDALSTPYTFLAEDSVMLAGDKLQYAADDAALKTRWRQSLKYSVLAKYVDLKKAQEGLKDGKDTSGKVVKVKADADLETEARESVKTSQARFFKRLRKMDEGERFSLFVNAITTSEDPHTDFFPPKDKSKFDEMMSGSFVGIGAQLREENDKIKVQEVIVGSPCWKQGQLKAGDEIQKVGQGKKEPEDITGMEIDDVVKRIRGEKGSEVRLTVKKVDGTVKVIPIIRDNVSREETFAKSAIIGSKDGPVGYIYLPEFYADFNHSGGRRCADDVAIEVQKLKEAGVTGIILDLRNNGGGSLSDVVDMAGLFVEQGPIVQVRSSDASPSILRDGTAGTLYDGPLAVMVNSGSASASEIMAAAMQDYKRAIIVGSPTYGKGTVQKVVGLDEFADPVNRMKIVSGSEPSLGAIKLTVQKFYRINGASTQQRGVTPDIRLPDPYSLLDLGERKEKSSLKYDEIPAAKYAASNVVKAQALASASTARVAASEAFRLINQSAQELKDRSDDAEEDGRYYPLSERAYRADQEKSAAISKKMDDLQKKGTPMAITNPKQDMERINQDASSKEKNATWVKALQKDLYLSETVNIVNDMTRMNGGKSIGMGMK